MMIRLFLFISVLFLVACGTQGPDGAPGTPPVDLGKDLGGHGTITSGGGNTVDGKMAERYSEDIESLPEYAHYIIPQFRKLSQIHADVLVAYLHWAAKNKTWYFVPVHLPALPKERIALAFQSDQIALHSEKEIFIDRQAYLEESERERAFLLMHEMVMGAKLLMKQSPQKQCELLNGVLDPSICSDPAVLKTAVNDPGQINAQDPEALLNGRDHESVRAMTVFLMDPKSDLQGGNVATRRLALDFNFPWDRALSHLNSEQVTSAIERTSLAEDTFHADPSFASKTSQTCRLKVGQNYNDWMFTVGFAKPFENDSTKFNLTYTRYSSNPIDYNARGVLNPNGNDEMVDLVVIEPFGPLSAYETSQRGENFQYKLELYISRDAQPHVIEYRVVPVAVRTKISYPGPSAAYENESIEIHSVIPLRCRLN